MPADQKNAIVVGGSLAGLMAAIVLKNLGFEVQVFERSEPHTLESQAAGIRAGPEVHDFIEQYIPNFHSGYATTTDAVDIINQNGEVEKTIPANDPLRLTTWKAMYEMLKQAAISESDGKKPVQYQTSQLVCKVKDKGESLTVVVKDLGTNTERSFKTDMVIAADGAHSAVRKSVAPEIAPKYAGYVSWRRRIPESKLSPQTQAALRSRCVMLRVESGYQISYYVPAEGSNPDSQERDFVWIWYDTLPESSTEFSETFTDVEGIKHGTTIPRGKMDAKVWRKQLERKDIVANRYFIELMEKIDEPFISAIRDFQGSKATFYNGKLLLTGDALSLCRPHGGGSTSQAALQARLLAEVVKGQMTLQEWEEACLANAVKAAQFSMAMAQFFWAGKMPPA